MGFRNSFVSYHKSVSGAELPMSFPEPRVHVPYGLLKFQYIAVLSGVLGEIHLADAPQSISRTHGVCLFYSLALPREKSEGCPCESKQEEPSESQLDNTCTLYSAHYLFLRSYMEF